MNEPTILDVITSACDIIHRGDIQTTTDSWRRAGFSDLDASLVSDWCDAGCFVAMVARRLNEAGVTPEQASQEVGVAGQERSIAYWVSNGDLSIKQALELVQP